jgi:hypothetical protein
LFSSAANSRACAKFTLFSAPPFPDTCRNLKLEALASAWNGGR